jgi:hypothetical protein
MADTQWNPIQEARQKYPGLKDWTDTQILKDLSDPAKFRSAFPQYASLPDSTISKNMANLWPSVLHADATRYKGPAPRSSGSRFISSALAPIKGAAKAMFDANPTPEEQRKGLTTPFDFWTRPIGRVVEAQTGQVDEARDLAKQGRYSEAAGHAIASAVPLLGPWVADAAQQYYGQVGSGDTAGALGTAVGNTAMAFAPETVGKARELAPRAAAAAADLAMRPLKAVTRTGQHAVRELVNKTQEANAGLPAKQAAYNRDIGKTIQGNRAVEVARKAKSDQAAAKNVQGSQLISRLNQLDQSLRRKVNGMYDAVREKVGAATEPGEYLGVASRQALQKIPGSTERPKIFRDILSKYPEAEPETIEYQGAQIPKGAPLYDVLKQHGAAGAPAVSFADLQGYYTELGSELSRGNLPADVYQATKTLQESVGNLMQRMANKAGAGQDLITARKLYREYMDTFHEPTGPSASGSPVAKALNAKDPERAVDIFAGKSGDRGVALLRRYDPDLANLAQEAQWNARTKLPAPKAKRSIADLERPSEPKKIGAEDIRRAKTDNLKKRAEGIRNASPHIANTLVVLDSIRNTMHGNFGGVAEDVGARVAYGAGKQAIASLLENQRVVDYLTKATASDVAAIPEDLRGDFPQIVRRAQAQGLKVSPALTLAFTGAAALAPRVHEQHPTDTWQGVRQ